MKREEFNSMKMFRKGKLRIFFSIFMTLMMVVGSLATAPIATMATTSAQLTAGTVSGTAGAPIQVPVTLTSSSDVKGLQFDLSYDHSLLTYQGKTAGSLTSAVNTDGDKLFTISQNTLPNGDSRVMIYTTDSSSPVIAAGSGTVVELNFLVSAAATAGQTCALGLSGVVLSDSIGVAMPSTSANGQFSIPQANYTVGFEENGGSAVTDLTQASGTTIATSPVSTKDGYTLEGWYTDADLTSNVTFPYTITSSVTFYAKWAAQSGATREPGGDVSNSVFYIAVKDASDVTKYYYYTKAELQANETQQAYTYGDHGMNKTVTCKGDLLIDLLKDLKGVTITPDMIVQYAEEDAYHADAATAVINSNYKDTVKSLTEQTLSGSGSTKNPMRSIITYAIHEEYETPDANNVNDAAGVFKDADNNSGFLRAYRDTADANSAVLKYMMGVVVSKDGALLTGNNSCVVTCVSDKNPTLKVIDDVTIKGLLPGMQYAVKAPAVTNAAVATSQTNPTLITVGSGATTTQTVNFAYTEDTYFFVKNTSSGAVTNYTYTDFKAMNVQVPDAINTAPYGYSRPMYYRYNGVWLSDLVSGISGDYTVKLVAKDGTKTDITDKIAQYFAAYNNTQSKTSTNIPEGKRVTVNYNDAKVIIPGTGVNITGSGASDYTSAGNDVTVLLAAAEGLEITPKQVNNSPKYTITPETNSAYTNGATPDGIKTMTVNSGINSLKYFAVNISPVTAHDGQETVVFAHLRDGLQLEMNATKADFDNVQTAIAGFNVLDGDVVKVYIVDDLSNALDFNPTVFQ